MDFLTEKLQNYFSSSDFTIKPICEGGSARQFYRATFNGKSVIVSITSDLEEFDYYTSFEAFFSSNNIPVPHFYNIFRDLGMVIMEDLGENSLYNLVKTSLESDIISIYKKVLSKLVDLQEVDVSKNLKINERPFDYKTLSWETEYFAEHFAGTFLKRQDLINEKIIKEFSTLAKEVQKQPIVAMHRDFQSQNIYIKEGNVYFIDFQGARTGPLFYDAASLINDPYVNLKDHSKQKLFEFYYNLVSGKGIYKDNFYSARKGFLNASLQRIMQALGAYGNLGINKGKTAFLQHIQPAVVTLEKLLEQSEDYFELKKIIGDVKTILQS